MQHWHQVDAAARVRHGIITKAQLRTLDVSEHQLRKAVEAGLLQPVHRAVYRLAGSPRTWHQDLTAAVAAAGLGAAASHRAAAQLWGLLPTGQPVEVSVPRERAPRLHGVTVHRSGDLGARWVRTRAAIAVTDPLRTMLDLGAVVREPVVRDALERGLTAGRFSVAALEWVRVELAARGRSGCGVLGSVLDERALGSSPADGLLEPRFARLCRQHGVEEPIFHHVVRDHAGRVVAEVDFAYPDVRLFIEVDGWEVHGTAPALTNDLDRQNRLVALGWTPLRFTWAMVVRQPEQVAVRISTVLGALRAT